MKNTENINNVYVMHVYAKDGHLMTYDVSYNEEEVRQMIDYYSINYLHPSDLICVHYNEKLVFADYAE